MTSTSILFANSGIAPIPNFSYAPAWVLVQWGFTMSFAAIFAGLFLFWCVNWRKDLRGWKIVLCFLATIGFLCLSCFISSLDHLKEIDGRARSMRNLTQIGLAHHEHSDVLKHLPAGATYDANGRSLHGWQTALLPFIEHAAIHQQIDHTAPWNAPANAHAFSQEMPLFLQPSVGPTQQDGYALSHYVGNIHVLGDKPMKLTEIKDGTSYTILAGEIGGDFRPWGEPMNCRDPAIGLNKPGSLGNPRGQFILILFADGTVRRIRPNIAPDLLKALSTPNGGENIDDTNF